jgi:hypothetical protein
VKAAAQRMTAADALTLIDEIYAANRRETWTWLLASDAEPDIESIEETFANLDRAFAEERARLVAFLETLPEGDALATR